MLRSPDISAHLHPGGGPFLYELVSDMPLAEAKCGHMQAYINVVTAAAGSPDVEGRLETPENCVITFI